MNSNPGLGAKKRGWWLTILFIYFLTTNIYGIIFDGLLLADPNKPSVITSGSPLPTTLQGLYAGILFDIITLIAVFFLFNWKKIGFYIYCSGLFLRGIIILILSGFSTIGIILWILELIIGLGILYLSMRSRWNLFT